jgi:hypothetical protein
MPARALRPSHAGSPLSDNQELHPHATPVLNLNVDGYCSMSINSPKPGRFQEFFVPPNATIFDAISQFQVVLCEKSQSRTFQEVSFVYQNRELAFCENGLSSENRQLSIHFPCGLPYNLSLLSRGGM